MPKFHVELSVKRVIESLYKLSCATDQDSSHAHMKDKKKLNMFFSRPNKAVTFTPLWANSADNKLMFHLFSQTTWFDITCKLTICRKIQEIFFWENRKKKKISICRLLNSFHSIMKTCLYNFDPFKPHFYIVKLGFTGVLIKTASPRQY